MASLECVVTSAIFSITSEPQRARAAGNCMAVVRASDIWKTGVSAACRNDDITVTACEANIATAGVVVNEVRASPLKITRPKAILNSW